MSPLRTFRTRSGRRAADEPLTVLRGLAMEDLMREAKKPTACPECNGRVLALRTPRGEKVLVDLPSPDRDPRNRASVTQDDDGRAIELQEGQIPIDGRQAFVPHRLTCKVMMQAARDAALDRMEDRGRRAAAEA